MDSNRLDEIESHLRYIREFIGTLKYIFWVTVSGFSFFAFHEQIFGVLAFIFVGIPVFLWQLLTTGCNWATSESTINGPIGQATKGIAVIIAWYFIFKSRKKKSSQ